ncbi:MAG: DNA-formamidopyrimidine glycosylase family protein [Bryobacteraceae bacterium]
MPEGDTIFRAARTLHRALAGQVVTRFETQLPALARVDTDHPIAGRTVESVRASGKWLLMQFSGNLTLLTHMLMSGSWHIYRPGETWQRGRFHMRIVVETASFVAVAFDVPIAEFHSGASLARRERFNRLGPGILADDFDETSAVRSLAARSELETGVALLNQSVLAGIGNVFKSEVCFLAGVNPFQKVGQLTAVQMIGLVQTARKLMQANVADSAGERIVTYSGLRRTTGRSDPSAKLWVYGRAGEPCRKCGAIIVSQKQGMDARVTFWCPACQGPAPTMRA